LLAFVGWKGFHDGHRFSKRCGVMAGGADFRLATGRNALIPVAYLSLEAELVFSLYRPL
jgi:hypothetical protein